MKIILNILLIALVVATAAICITKPDMHKTLVVYDSAYTIVPEKKVEIEKEVIPIMERPAQQKPEVKTIDKAVRQVVQTPVKTVQPQKTVVKQTVHKPQVQTVKTVTTAKPQNVTQQKVSTQLPKAETNKVSETKKVEPVVVKTVTEVPAVKTLTQQEEIIAWNKWRSNVQNKIMQDVKLPLMPNGTTFKFTFTVDKYGKVSNVQTWAEPSNYTPYAIQYIAPVIRSYQGRAILSFPQGSSRITTDVKGGWKISENEKYSSPKDYNDVEKVTR